LARPHLSLCMIVRNEQEMLPEMLASVDGLWDELVVADTGSTDGTAALLEAAGAKVITHPWDDDFAAARNASLAAATGAWILCLDADERVTPTLKTQIRTVLKDNRAGAATVTMRNTLPDGSHHLANLLRLFRNDPDIRFRHRIHEDVLADVSDFLDRKHLLLRHLSGIVEHLGYVREVAAERDKRQRDQDLLWRVLDEDPDDFYCWFKLLESARFWDDRPLWTRVTAVVEPLLTGTLPVAGRQELRRNPWSGELAVLVSEGLDTGDAQALDWLEKWRDRFHIGGAWHLRRALLLENLQRREEAADAFTDSLDSLGAVDEHLRARILLGQCRLAAAAGNLPRAWELATGAATAAPTDPEALLAAVTFGELTGGTAQVTAFVTRHHQDHPVTGKPLAEALLRAGQADLAYSLLSNLTAAEPPLAMGLLTCALALGQDVDLNVDLEQEKADTAFKDWIRILWESRRTRLMTVFAENCGSVTEIFPWLEEYLGAETERLRTK